MSLTLQLMFRNDRIAQETRAANSQLRWTETRSRLVCLLGSVTNDQTFTVPEELRKLAPGVYFHFEEEIDWGLEVAVCAGWQGKGILPYYQGTDERRARFSVPESIAVISAHAGETAVLSTVVGADIASQPRFSIVRYRAARLLGVGIAVKRIPVIEYDDVLPEGLSSFSTAVYAACSAVCLDRTSTPVFWDATDNFIWQSYRDGLAKVDCRSCNRVHEARLEPLMRDPKSRLALLDHHQTPDRVIAVIDSGMCRKCTTQ